MAKNVSVLQNLLILRAEAAQAVKVQINRGYEIRNLGIDSEKDLEKAHLEQFEWLKDKTNLLNCLFDDESIKKEYDLVLLKSTPFTPLFSWKVNDFREGMEYSINLLKNLLKCLELIPELGEEYTYETFLNQPSSSLAQSLPLKHDIFIVHGHDDEAKLKVADFVRKLGLNPIVLHEEPNAGRTTIKKFEDCSDVGFAIVLLTSDDIGAAKNKSESLKPRARQNVIFELGYFVGKFTRSRVCTLYREGVERPSDWDGVGYVEMDSGNGWKLKLAQEIKHAGIEIDMNKLLLQ